jgi:hypothetical protein
MPAWQGLQSKTFRNPVTQSRMLFSRTDNVGIAFVEGEISEQRRLHTAN